MLCTNMPDIYANILLPGNSTFFITFHFLFDLDLFCFRRKCDGIDANVLYTPAMIVPILIVSHSRRGFNGKTLSQVSCFANLDIH